ncbi:MAG TPA: hypothetical protein VEC16_03070 [Alphaproteobacteria bacterium]|nr:hypothetical protein [Alphaproteobacteria bacterium]
MGNRKYVVEMDFSSNLLEKINRLQYFSKKAIPLVLNCYQEEDKLKVECVFPGSKFGTFDIYKKSGYSWELMTDVNKKIEERKKLVLNLDIQEGIYKVRLNMSDGKETVAESLEKIIIKEK